MACLCYIKELHFKYYVTLRYTLPHMAGKEEPDTLSFPPNGEVCKNVLRATVTHVIQHGIDREKIFGI